MLIKFGFIFLKKEIKNVNVEEIVQKNLFLTKYSTKSSRYPLLVLHGLSRKGRKDHRLVHFTETLSKIGFTVYTLDLFHLKNLEFNIKDINIINKGIQYIYHRENYKLGLIGFSVGGSYALISSSMNTKQNMLKYVFAVGSYFRINTLFENMQKIINTDPYGALVAAYNNTDKLNLNKDDLFLFQSVMDNYCEKKDCFDEKEKAVIKKIIKLVNEKKLFENVMKNLKKYSQLNLFNNNYLNNINIKVLLLHSKNDPVIPVSESRKIYNTLISYNKEVMFNMSKKSDHVNFHRGNLFGVLGIFYKMMQLSQE